MALDLTQIISQIVDLVDNAKKMRREHDIRIRTALETIEKSSADLTGLQEKVSSSKATSTWLMAYPREDTSCVRKNTEVPADYCVIASDGSHIDVDRHHAVSCFLTNISLIMLRYGGIPDAYLGNTVKLHYTEDDLKLVSPDGRYEVKVEGNLLGIKRDLAEFRMVVDTMLESPPEVPFAGLTDGTLIAWSLDPQPEFVKKKYLNEGYLDGFSKLKDGKNSDCAGIAGYISYPGSADVVNMLKAALCPREVVDTDKCQSCDTKECAAIEGLRDREIFSVMLAPGERSAVFESTSKILNDYGDNKILFFYLKLDDEIARVEIPEWVFLDQDKIDNIHSMILDQCHRGHGYPVSLMEAHEKAVINGADRENFWYLVDEMMAKADVSSMDSAKSNSKRIRSL